MTPESPEPIWVAKRTLCASPPARVVEERSSVRYSSPTSIKNCNLAETSFKSGRATSAKTFFGKFLIGVDKEKVCFWAKSESIYQYHDCLPTLCEALAQGKIAPSSIVKFLLGKTRSGLTSSVCPRPVHLSQAPYGELKEKRRGSIGGKDISQTGHANCSEKRCMPAFSTETIAIPSPFRSAVSKESTRRDLSVSLSKINLSTTTSKECFFFRLSFSSKASSKLITMPSSLTLRKPSRAKI